ncbi:MAG: porin [Candidatus Protistobacter heckmanni]|nr:porin [Candidatus Protistobacter heckmanni]
MESFFQTTTGAAGRLGTDPLFSRNAYVGIEGGYGRATLGRHPNLLYLSEQWINPFSASILFSPLVMQTTQPQFGGVTLGDTFWNNVLQYATPNLSGWSAIAHVGVGGLAGSNAANNLALSVKYEGGPLTAVAMAQNDRIANATTATPSPAPWTTAQLAWLAGGAYDLKPVKLYGAAQGTDGGSTVGQKSLTWSSGLSWSTTPSGSVLAAWANTRVSAPGKADTRRNTATFGYDYCLSKRTDLYAVYVYDKQTGQGPGNTLGAGIRHVF